MTTVFFHKFSLKKYWSIISLLVNRCNASFSVWITAHIYDHFKPIASMTGNSLKRKQCTETQLQSQSLIVTAVSLLSQIAGMVFFSTGNCSFQCTPRCGMVGNQCTALIKTLTSCLHRKLTCLLLISCRSHSVCEIVLPITTCLSMTTSTRMWPYQCVICCPTVRSNQVVWWM